DGDPPPSISGLAVMPNGSITFTSSQPVAANLPNSQSTSVEILPNHQGVVLTPDDGSEPVTLPPPAGLIPFVLPGLGQTATLPHEAQEEPSLGSIPEGADVAGHIAAGAAAQAASEAGKETLEIALDKGAGPLMAALLAYMSAKSEGKTDEEAGAIA